MTKQRENTKQNIMAIAGNSLLVFFAVLCTLGVLISAFSFPVYMFRASFFWLIVSIALATTAQRFRYKGILLSLIPALFLFIIFSEDILAGGRWLAFFLTDYYSNWLVITVLFPEAYYYYELDPTTFFTAFGIFLAILLSIAICLQRSTFMSALCTVPVVMLAFVVVAHNHPAFIYIFGLLVVHLTLLLTNALVFDDYRKRGLMTIPALVIALIFTGVSYIANPPERFDRAMHNAVINRNFNVIASSIGNLWELVPNPGRGVGWPFTDAEGGIGGVWAFNTHSVNIADSGNMFISDRSLLEVVVTEPGTFYLRGYSMQHFDGRSWTRNSSFDVENYQRDEGARNFPGRIAMFHSEVWENEPRMVGMNITRTGDRTNIEYIPYFMTPPEIYIDIDGLGLDGYDVVFPLVRQSVHQLLEELTTEHPWEEVYGNGSPLSMADSVGAEYRFATFASSPEYLETFVNMHGVTVLSPELETVILPLPNAEEYLQVDENTAAELRRIALQAGINPNASRTEVSDAVARFVRNSATYSLAPGVVPEEEDFVLFFLEHMETGFCIHFATTATLMLRSLGIPARFTTGYVFTVPTGYQNEVITLTDRNAHAWVEVFYDDIGWLYLETTPGGEGSAVTATTPHTPGAEIEGMFSPPQMNWYDFEPWMMDFGDHMINGAFVNGQGQATPPAGIGGAAAAAAAIGIEPWLFNLIIVIVLIVLVIASVFIRRGLVLRFRKKRFEQTDANAAVISMWKYIERIARREAVPPTEIEKLALKARFSPHKISSDERSSVKVYANRLADEIYRSKDGPARIWVKYARVF
ncbi:MAG: transglutaminaseTgpA domain-containing protein [Oscillospiraceae bacterium]|nr:transglutaminaseTgpA domain-containing protein [Oscillospiraceae bacterium]